MRDKRDNFTIKTKSILGKRVGYLCSNPKCQKPTIGPSSDPIKTVNIGVAAHISAASKNGPRFNSSITQEKRKAISNGIWLCQNCSVLIDRDPNKYTVSLLEKWKHSAEKFISKSIESGHFEIEYFVKEKVIRAFDIGEKKTQFFFLSKENELIYRYKEHELKLDYYPNKEDWDSLENYLDQENKYHYVLLYLPIHFAEIEYSKHADSIKDFQTIIIEKGIEGLCEYLFDLENINSGVPKYKEFQEIIVDYFTQPDSVQNIQPIGSNFHVWYKNTEYLVDTYSGLRKELDSYISRKSYSEIYTMTNECHWSDIYLDLGIKKSQFIPELLNNWESFWNEKYEEIKSEIGNTSHLDKMKDSSWRQFQIFSEGYNEAVDIIKFSYDLGDLDLYPLVVYTMLNIFDKECCYLEYCELEFEYGDWDIACLDKKEYKTPIFHIIKEREK